MRLLHAFALFSFSLVAYAATFTNPIKSRDGSDPYMVSSYAWNKLSIL
jgi:hypothetical protein